VEALVPLLMILMFIDLTAAERWLAERRVYRQHHRRVKTHSGKISEPVTCGAAWNPTTCLPIYAWVGLLIPSRAPFADGRA
jgi:hypothetical protein